MDLRSIYSPAPSRGWLPWGLLAPVVCLVLAIATQLPAELWLEKMGFLDPNGETTGTSGLIAFLLVPFSAWGLAVLAWVSWIERRSLATIGLALPGSGRTFLGGHLAGVATVSAVVFGIWLAGAYQPQGIALAFADRAAMVSIAVLLVCFVVQAGFEEIIFRGWLLSVITRRWNLVVAILLSSALFTLLHFSRGQPWLVTANVVLFAVFACSWAIAENNVWGVMGWHAGWNWMLATGFEVPVTGVDAHLPALAIKLVPIGTDFLTGGAQGPEGSILCTLFFVCGIAFFAWRIRRAGAGEKGLA
jgi:membrane protease YdiL (CAAX protease family)